MTRIEYTIDGRFAADGGIDRREQRGGDVDVCRPPFERGSCKTSHVGYYSAAYVDYERMPRAFVVRQIFPDFGERLQIFVFLSRCDRNERNVMCIEQRQTQSAAVVVCYDECVVVSVPACGLPECVSYVIGESQSVFLHVVIPFVRRKQKYQ